MNTTLAVSAPEPPAAPPTDAVAEVFVDSHVHLYPVYDRTTFFDAAERNVRRAGGSGRRAVPDRAADGGCVCAPAG